MDDSANELIIFFGVDVLDVMDGRSRMTIVGGGCF